MELFELDEKMLPGLLLGSIEQRLDLLNNEKVLKSLDIDAFNRILKTEGTTRESKYWRNEDDMYDAIKILQVLAYNRHKTIDSDKTADFVFDKLFELLVSHDLF